MNKSPDQPLHREVTPVRQCGEPGCGTWLSSANRDDFCVLHGGWSVQRYRAESKDAREDRADLYAELLEA